MGLHQMFWIKREMVVKGRERERESSQEKGYTLPSMPCGKLTCNIIPVSLCFERERERNMLMYVKEQLQVERTSLAKDVLFVYWNFLRNGGLKTQSLDIYLNRVYT